MIVCVPWESFFGGLRLVSFAFRVPSVSCQWDSPCTDIDPYPLCFARWILWFHCVPRGGSLYDLCCPIICCCSRNVVPPSAVCPKHLPLMTKPLTFICFLEEVTPSTSQRQVNLHSSPWYTGRFVLPSGKHMFIASLSTWNCGGFKSVSLSEETLHSKIPSTSCLKHVSLVWDRRPSLSKVLYSSCGFLGWS